MKLLQLIFETWVVIVVFLVVFWAVSTFVPEFITQLAEIIKNF